jgi:hypothetical protein
MTATSFGQFDRLGDVHLIARPQRPQAVLGSRVGGHVDNRYCTSLMPEHVGKCSGRCCTRKPSAPVRLDNERAGPASGLPSFVCPPRACAEEDRYGVTTFMLPPSLTMTA